MTNPAGVPAGPSRSRARTASSSPSSASTAGP